MGNPETYGGVPMTGQNDSAYKPPAAPATQAAQVEVDDSKTMGIMGFALPKGLCCRFADTLRCGKIRLADFQMNNLASLSFKFMGAFKDVHDNKWRDFFSPFAYVFHDSL